MSEETNLCSCHDCYFSFLFAGSTMFVEAAGRVGKVRHHQPDVRRHQHQPHPDQYDAHYHQAHHEQELHHGPHQEEPSPLYLHHEPRGYEDIKHYDPHHVKHNEAVAHPYQHKEDPHPYNHEEVANPHLHEAHHDPYYHETEPHPYHHEPVHHQPVVLPHHVVQEVPVYTPKDYEPVDAGYSLSQEYGPRRPKHIIPGLPDPNTEKPFAYEDIKYPLTGFREIDKTIEHIRRAFVDGDPIDSSQDM